MITGVMAAKKTYQYHNHVLGIWYDDSDISMWLSVDPMADAAPNWSPYNYCWANPVNNIDPFGLWGEDKAKRKQKRAAERYGEDRVTDVKPFGDGKNDYGFQIVEDSDGDIHDHPLENEAGVSSSKRRTITDNKAYRNFKSDFGLYNPMYISGFGSFVPGGGASVSLGWARDRYGNSTWFTTIGGGVGLETGFGVNAGLINPTADNEFNVTDLEGKGFQYDVGAWFLSAGSSGDFKEQDKFQFQGDNYNMEQFGVSKFGRFKFGGSYQWNKTFLFGKRSAR